MKIAAIHSIPCQANHRVVFDIIKHSENWPTLFEPCQSVKKIESSDQHELFEIQAMVGPNLMTWVSHRTFKDEIFGVDTTVTQPVRLLKSMQANWRVIKVNAQECLITLTHDYEIADDISGIVEGVETQTEAADYMANAIEINSIKELENISDIARAMDKQDKWSTLHNTVCDCPPEHAYEVLKDIERWPNIFDVCQSAKITEHNPEYDLIEIQAASNDNTLTWVTKRRYQAETLTINFELTTPMPKQASMSGMWRVIPYQDNRCIILVERDIVLSEDATAEDYRAMQDFIESNSTLEMSALADYMAKHAPLQKAS